MGKRQFLQLENGCTLSDLNTISDKEGVYPAQQHFIFIRKRDILFENDHTPSVLLTISDQEGIYPKQQRL
eukprot:3325193-Karenia_brevis.AAC.1